jgi:hypothetical protein
MTSIDGGPRWPIRILSETHPDQIPPAPDMETVPETTIEVRHSVNEDNFFSLIFIAGNQGRIVEANDTVTDNYGGLERFLGDLISEKPYSYIEIDRLGCQDHILIRKLDTTRVLLQIYEPVETYGEGSTNLNSTIFLEAIVGYRKLVWELYTSFCHLAIDTCTHGLTYKSVDQSKVDWRKIHEVHGWLGFEKQSNHHSYPDDLFGDDPLDTPWSR